MRYDAALMHGACGAGAGADADDAVPETLELSTGRVGAYAPMGGQGGQQEGRRGIGDWSQGRSSASGAVTGLAAVA